MEISQIRGIVKDVLEKVKIENFLVAGGGFEPPTSGL